MTGSYWEDDSVQLYVGDCLDVLRALPDASVDAVCTDPPYELAFMGRAWDASGIAFNPAVWAQVLRVLKPGGHLLAFGGARTYHRLAVAVEDAGFEIRDSIHWLFGGGFPKGIDVAKTIDRAGGASPAEQARLLREARERAGLTRQEVADAVGCTPGSLRDWEDGRARAAGRDVEHIVPSPRYRAKLAGLLGYSADERVIAGLQGEAIRDVYQGGWKVRYADPTTPVARQWDGWNTALKPAHEPIVLARKPLSGTVAGNVLEHGTGALNIDATRVAAGQEYRDKCASVVGIGSNRNGDAYGDWPGARTDSAHQAGRWPTNAVFSHPPLIVDGEVVGDACASGCVDGCPVWELDAQSGERPSGGSPGGTAMNTGLRGNTFTRERPERPSDSGGASRYFPTFRYEAKAPARERPRLADGTTHPTTKPLNLVRWLVRLVTPPGGVVLDPFAGSGTTGEAAVIEGFRAVLIEREEPYAELVKVRLGKPIAPVLGLGDAL